MTNKNKLFISKHPVINPIEIKNNKKPLLYSQSFLVKLLIFAIGIFLIYTAFPNKYYYQPLFSWFCFVPLFYILLKEINIFKRCLWAWCFFQAFFSTLFYFQQQTLPSVYDIEYHSNGIILFKCRIIIC